MNDTIDLTTPQGLFAEERRLSELLGHKKNVSIGVCKEGASVYFGGTDYGKDFKFFRAETFAQAIAKADEYIVQHAVTHKNNTIRKMALAIIEITDEHTRCTETLLRGKGFSSADITEFRDAACERASEMCGNAPFVVEAV